MSGDGGDFTSSLIVSKSDNLLVQWAKMLTSNICSKWWVAPLLVIAVIYLYWKLDECQTKLKKYEGMSSDQLPARQALTGVTDFAKYHGGGTLTHTGASGSFSEQPSFWATADASVVAANQEVESTARALNRSGWGEVKSAGLSQDDDVSAVESDGGKAAIVAEAFKSSKQDAELAMQL